MTLTRASYQAARAQRLDFVRRHFGAAALGGEAAAYVVGLASAERGDDGWGAAPYAWGPFAAFSEYVDDGASWADALERARGDVRIPTGGDDPRDAGGAWLDGDRAAEWIAADAAASVTALRTTWLPPFVEALLQSLRAATPPGLDVPTEEDARRYYLRSYAGASSAEADAVAHDERNTMDPYTRDQIAADLRSTDPMRRGLAAIRGGGGMTTLPVKREGDFPGSGAAVPAAAASVASSVPGGTTTIGGGLGALAGAVLGGLLVGGASSALIGAALGGVAGAGAGYAMKA